jgi:hypothetical protein
MRLLCLSALLVAANAAHAGTILETISRELAPDGESSTMSTYAQAGSMRVEGNAGDGVMIFRNDTIYLVNPREKSYAIMDHETMKRMAEQVNPALKQMREQLAKMPPEQREQMEKMMAQRMPGLGKQKTQDIRKTSRTEKIGGVPCTYVEVVEDGVLSDELCVAAPGALKGTQELMDAAMKMSALLKEMTSTLDAPWLKDMMERQAANYEKLGGVPVLTRHFTDGKASHETTIKSVRTEAIPAASFEVPAGYTKKDLMSR